MNEQQFKSNYAVKGPKRLNVGKLHPKYFPIWFRWIAQVEGSSMLPTLTDRGNIFCSSRRVWKRGDIVNLVRIKEDNTLALAVKRIIGLPGDVVHINNRTGDVSINDVILVEPYILGKTVAQVNYITVPEDHVFVLGDNREQSADSRAWGCIPTNCIISRVCYSTNYDGQLTKVLRMCYDYLPETFVKGKGYDITELHNHIKELETKKDGSKKLHGETHKCSHCREKDHH